MSFLNILFLAGMAALAGPVLAHLLARPRYRRIPFTMMQFLEAGQLESNQRRRIRNLLMLLLRCAIIACIVLGFAGPVMENIVTTNGDGAALYIGVDDSLSMAYGNRFGEARDRILSELANRSGSTQVDITGMASGARIQGVSPEAAITFLQGLEPIVGQARLDAFLGSLQARDRESGRADIILSSDFTPQFLEQLEGVKAPIPAAQVLALVPDNEHPIDNLSVEHVGASAALDGGLVLTVRIKNQDSESRVVDLQAMAGPDLQTTEQVEVFAGRSRSVELKLESPSLGSKSLPVAVSLAPTDKLAADDAYYLGLSFPEKTDKHVLILCNDRREAFLVETAIEVLSAELPHLSFTTQVMPYARLDQSALQGADAVVITAITPELMTIAQALETYLQGGGDVITFLHRAQDPGTISALYQENLLPALPSALRQESATLALSNQTQSGVRNPDALRALENYNFRDYVFDAWYNCQVGPTTQIQWPFEGSDALLYQCAVGQGESILLNTSADDSLSGLTKSPAILPLYTYLLGTDGRLEVAAYPAAMQTGHAYIWPDDVATTGTVPVQLLSPGGARLSTRYENGALAIPAIGELGLVMAYLEPPVYAGLNVPEGETDLTPPTQPMVDQAMARLFQQTAPDAAQVGEREESERTPYGAWALSAALVLLLIETLVANRMVR